MPQGIPTDSITKNKAVGMLAQGLTQTSVAKQVGVHRTTINQLAKQEREAVNELALKLVAQSRDKVLDNHIKTLDLANDILSAKDKDSKEYQDLVCSLARLGLEPKDILTLSDKKEQRALQIMGIMPTHTQSIVIQNIFNDNRTQVLDPIMAQSFRADAIRFNDDDIEDAEYSEDDGIYDGTS